MSASDALERVAAGVTRGISVLAQRDQYMKGWRHRVAGGQLPDDASPEFLVGWRDGRDAMLDAENWAEKLFTVGMKPLPPR